MSTLAEIRRKHNSKKLITSEGVKTYGQLTSEKMKEETLYLNSLEERFEENPMSLTMEELINLKKRIGENPDKINLNYKNGFVMLSKDSFSKKALDEMPYDVQGIVQKLGRSINKNGCIIYDNNRPVQNISDLLGFLKITRKIWNKFSEYNDKFLIIKKEKIDNVWYLVMNPMFYSGNYEITYFRFLVFGRFLKENNYINELDYAILCKKHEIVPEP